jgi:hypothetical protein
MRVLVIDDLRSVLPDFEPVTYARTPKEGVERLTEGNWNLVCLDHDMGFDFTTGPLEIWPCIEYIEQNAEEFKKTTFYVITSSPVGGDRMMYALHRAGLTAFRIGYTEKKEMFTGGF